MSMLTLKGCSLAVDLLDHEAIADRAAKRMSQAYYRTLADSVITLRTTQRKLNDLMPAI